MRTLRLPCLLIIACAAGCGARQNQAPAPPPPPVTVARPIVTPITPYHEYTGQTDAVESVDVRARVRGFLLKIDFQEGTEVSAGTLLYEIDPSEYQATL